MTVDKIDRSREGVIKAWFDFNKDTGEIRWKQYVSPKWYKRFGYYLRFMRDRAGKVVEFYTTQDGRLYIGAGGKTTIYAHQIVWVHTYGNLPDYQIDHIDGCPSNNAIENLRDVPQSINTRNAKMRHDNSSGVTGVSFKKGHNKWQAFGHVLGKRVHLGYFDTLEEASAARRKFIIDNRSVGYTTRHGKKQNT